MSPIAKSDYNDAQIERVKQDIINNLKNKRINLTGGNSAEKIISEYKIFFDHLKDEKVKQIESLEKIVEHLVKLNIDNSTLNYNLKKINDKISQLNIEISKI